MCDSIHDYGFCSRSKSHKSQQRLRSEHRLTTHKSMNKKKGLNSSSVTSSSRFSSEMPYCSRNSVNINFFSFPRCSLTFSPRLEFVSFLKDERLKRLVSQSMDSQRIHHLQCQMQSGHERDMAPQFGDSAQQQWLSLTLSLISVQLCSDHSLPPTVATRRLGWNLD